MSSFSAQCYFYGANSSWQLLFAWLHHMMFAMHNRQCQDKKDKITDGDLADDREAASVGDSKHQWR
jgi:hypothetical protein